MPNIKTTKAAGLFTSDNPYGSTPEGSFATADNVVIKNKDVVESRRGFGELGYDFSSSTARGEAIGFFDDTLVVNTKDGSTWKLARDTGAALTNYTGDFEPPDSAALRMKFAEAQQSLYFTTDEGIKSLDSATGTPTQSGMIRALGVSRGSFDLNGNPNATGTWMPVNTRVGYRLTICYKDENGRIIESVPSTRCAISNPANSTASIGAITRAGSTVTATIGAHLFVDGDVIALSPGEADGGADFAAGNYTLTGYTATTITWVSAGTNGTNGVQQTISSGAKNVRLRFGLPAAPVLTTEHFYRLYRTDETPSQSIDPGDECFLVYEDFVTSTDIANSYIQIIDATPFLASGAPLYTNTATGDGFNAANHQAPIAKDVATWQDRVWYANTTSKHRYEFQMLGVGSPDGVQSGDFLYIGGVGIQLFPVTLGDAPRNIEFTSIDLIESLNAEDGPALAYYMSSEDDFPGKMLIEESAIGGSTLAAAATRPASWNPRMPSVVQVVEASTSRTGSTVTVTTSTSHGFSVGQEITLGSNTGMSSDQDFPLGTKTVVTTPTATTFTYTEAGNADTMVGTFVVYANAVTSTNDAAPNRLYYSKLQQPEAVPLVNYLDVGSKLSAILRICPLRDKLFVFKEDGIFTVSGEYPFRVDLLDNTAKLIAPDSVVAVSNRIFALTSQGIVSVTDGGVAILSRPIENDLLPLLTDTVAGFKAACFGVGYETDRSYMLWLPASASDTTCTQAYVYNILANAWTRRTDAQTHAVVHPTSDRLYFCNAAYATLLKERKAFTSADYSDVEFATGTGGATIVGTTTDAPLEIAPTTGINIGDVISTDGGSGTVSAINGDFFTMVNCSGTQFTSGPCVCYPAIACSLVYNPQIAGAPGIQKQFREHSLHFGKSDFDLGYMTSKTEVSESTTSDIIATSSTATTATPKTFRKLIPLEKQRAGQLQAGFTLRQAWSQWRLFGHSIEVDAMSERTVK